MIIAIEKSTNKIIVSSSFSNIETELQNALNCGFTSEEVEVREVTDEEYQFILENQPSDTTPQQPSLEQRMEALEKLMMGVI
ncbi:hypothetical protein [Clostridium sp. UBA7503]|uniref:hypothetical protein n=1 Tax=Clostridium sp. UBA7503 TaxID=1946377 RepID=UPI003216FBE1